MSTLPAPRPALSLAASKALDVRPDEIVRRWLESVSDDARRAYARALATFTLWAMPDAEGQQDGLRLLCEAGAGGAHELLAAWRDHLLGRLAPGTVAGQLAAISALLRACRRAGLIAWRVEGIAPKRERVQDRRGPTRGEVERLLGHVDELAAAGDRKAVRDAAILRLLYCGALRRAEVVGLRLEDVAPDCSTVQPRRKGQRTRQPLAVSAKTAESLRAWLAVRGAAPGALFTRLDRAATDYAQDAKQLNAAVVGKKHLSGETIRAMLAARAGEAGIKSACRPHGLRHSAASELAKRGSLDELMALGGWKSLSAASAYLDNRDENRRRALALVDA